MKTSGFGKLALAAGTLDQFTGEKSNLMSIDEVMPSQFEASGERCAVCDKSVAGGSRYERLKYGEGMVALCCPFCLEAFQKDPEDWIGRQEPRRKVHAIYELL